MASAYFQPTGVTRKPYTAISAPGISASNVAPSRSGDGYGAARTSRAPRDIERAVAGDDQLQKQQGADNILRKGVLSQHEKRQERRYHAGGAGLPKNKFFSNLLHEPARRAAATLTT